MKFSLIITTIAFSVLGIASAWGLTGLTVIILAQAQRRWDYVGWTGCLGLFIVWMIPVAFAAGQGLAWRGYTLKKTVLIVLGMCLSFSPLMVWLILAIYYKLTRS
jgi:hypothetical protein